MHHTVNTCYSTTVSDDFHSIFPILSCSKGSLNHIQQKDYIFNVQYVITDECSPALYTSASLFTSATLLRKQMII